MDRHDATSSPGEATREVDASQESVRRSQKMVAVGEVTTAAAHEFNNLMHGIVASLELARRMISSGRGAETDAFLAKASAYAQRAASLNQHLVHFSRPQPAAPQVLSINALVTGIEDLLRYSMNHAFKLEITLAEGVWEVCCDANQAENAFIDMVMHARACMPHGGTVRLETRNCDAGEDEAIPRACNGGRQAVGIVVTATGRAVEPPPESRLAMVYRFARESAGAVKLARGSERTAVALYLPRFVANGAA